MAKVKHSTKNLDPAAGADIPGTLRLNGLDRSALHTALMHHAFGKKDMADYLREAALARRVYDLTYTAEERAWMEQAPEGALHEAEEIYVYVNGQQHRLQFYKSMKDNGYVDYEKRRIFRSNASWDRKHTLMVSAVEGNGSTGEKLKLAQDIETHLHEQRGREEEQRKASNQLTQTLKAFTSWRNLVAEWPEAEEIVRAVMLKRGYDPTRKVSTLPVVQLSEMNKMLGLPPEDEAVPTEA